MTAIPEAFSGVLVPVLTPFAGDLEPDVARFKRICRWLLDEGASGLAVFGTTSEGNSLTATERCRLIDQLVEAGVPARRLMPGTGACALPDAVAMTRHAVAAGAGGVLVLPPFYYKNQADEGFFAYFSEIIERVGDPRLKLYLYHFPQMSAAPITPALVERLLKTYPDTVAGLKDSSGDWDGTRRLIAAFPDLAIFPSSEVRLMEGLGLGAAGCISATANIQPGPIARLIAAHGSAEAEDWHRRISTVRGIVEAYPFITACKAIVARQTGDDAWLQTRPPLTPLDEARCNQLFAALDACGVPLEIAL